MENKSRRKRIAREAAKLISHGEERELHRARWKAARRVCSGQPPTHEMPGGREVREQLAAAAERAHAERAEEPAPSAELEIDRFRLFESLLVPLEHVHESRKTHPEGDVLYHSLQVFELAREEIPYDEDFLLAALLHDVGKAIDPKDHVAAGLAALEGTVSERTAWFIEHHVEALQVLTGELGVRARRRLEASENFHELMVLAECDRKGRRRGVRTPDVVDALNYVRGLADSHGESFNHGIARK